MTIKNKKTSKPNAKGKRNIRRSTSKRTGRRRITNSGIMLSPCSAHYAKAIADPWSPAAMGACIPKVPARPSRKVTGFTRQTAYTGTAGYGFLAICPCTANDSPFFFCSGTTFTGTSTSGVTPASIGVNAYNMTNLPVGIASYTVVDGSAPSSARIVSVGVSIQYVGTVLNKGGYIRSFVDPSHDNLFGVASGAALNSSAETVYLPVTSQKRSYAISAVDTEEYEYVNKGLRYDYYPFSNNQTFPGALPIGGAPMMIEWQSEPGNPFFIEVIVHIEYTGSAHQSALTPTHADAVGFEKVAGASALIPTIRKSQPNLNLQSLMDVALKTTIDTMKPIAYKAAQAGINYMAGSSSTMTI